jgi:hypothetical protein
VSKVVKLQKRNSVMGVIEAMSMTTRPQDSGSWGFLSVWTMKLYNCWSAHCIVNTRNCHETETQQPATATHDHDDDTPFFQVVLSRRMLLPH